MLHLALLLTVPALQELPAPHPVHELALAPTAELVAPPRIALDARGRLHVACAVAEGIDVLSSSDATFATFGEPIHAVRRKDLIVGGRRGPRIAATTAAGETVLVLCAITQRTKDPATGGDLLAWRSRDGGRTWSDPSRVSDVPGCAAEGLFDLAALSDGRFAAVWLDIREKGTRLRMDFSADGATWGADTVAYESPGGSICECCHPAITATSDGGALIAFRNSLGGDRDIWTMKLARTALAPGPATKSGSGSWKLAACPMAGPSIDIQNNDVVTAWRRERNVFVAVGAARERDLGIGTEPQLWIADDGVHVLWIADQGLVHLAPRAEKPELVAPNALFPTTLPSARGLVAWLDQDTHRAHVAALR